MSKHTHRKAKKPGYRRPWVLRRGPKVLGAFSTGSEALAFLRRLLTVAQP